MLPRAPYSREEERRQDYDRIRRFILSETQREHNSSSTGQRTASASGGERHHHPSAPAAATPSAHSQSARRPKRSTVVVVASSSDGSGDRPPVCPECGRQEWADSESFTTHLFYCRIDHNVSPMLPLRVLHGQPRSGNTVQRPQPPRHQRGALSPSSRRRSPAASGSSSHFHSTFDGYKHHDVPLTHHRQRSVDGLSGILGLLRPANGAPAVVEQFCPPLRRIENGSPTIDDGSATRDAIEALRKPIFSCACFAPVHVKRTKEERERHRAERLKQQQEAEAAHAKLVPPPSPRAKMSEGSRALMERVSQFLNNAAQANIDGTAQQQSDTASPPQPPPHQLLNLSGLALGVEHLPPLQIILSPSANTAALVQVLDLTSTVFTDPSRCATLLSRALMANETVEELRTDGCNLHERFIAAVAVAASPRSSTSNREAMANDGDGCGEASSSSVLHHVAMNEKRGRALRAKQKIDAMAIQYEAEKIERQRGLARFRDAFRRSVAAIHHEEKSARANLRTTLAAGLRAIHKKHQREVWRAARQREREQFAEVEHSSRVSHHREELYERRGIVLREEEAKRKSIDKERDLTRQTLRLREREDVMRSKEQERARVADERAERLTLESVESDARKELESTYVLSFDVFKRQHKRGRDYAKWRKQLRTDVSDFVDYETRTRSDIHKEEVSARGATNEKLQKAIDGIRARCLAQREAVERIENEIRTREEGAMRSLMEVGQKVFALQRELIAHYLKTRRRENERLELLRRQPTVVLSANSDDPRAPIFFCRPSPGQPPSDPISLLPSTKLSIGWSPSSEAYMKTLQDAEARCKSIVAEERSLVRSYLICCLEAYITLADARAIVDEPYHKLKLSTMLSGRSTMTPAMRPISPAMHMLRGGGGAATTPTTSASASGAHYSRKSARQQDSQLLIAARNEDPEFVHLKDEGLKWCSAWHDRHTAMYIRHEKERIVDAVINVKARTAPTTTNDRHSSSSGCDCGDRLLSTTRFECLFDGGEGVVQPLTEIGNLVLTEPSQASTGGGNESDRHSEQSCDELDPVMSMQSEPTPQKEPANPNACRRAKETIEIHCRNTAIESAATGGDSSPPDQPPPITLDGVLQALRTITFQNESSTTSDDISAAQTMTVRQFDVSIELHFTLQDSYGEEEAADENTYYITRRPPPNERVCIVKSSQRVTIVIVPPVFIFPRNEPLCTSRVLVEGQIAEVDLFPAISGIGNPPQIELLHNTEDPDAPPTIVQINERDNDCGGGGGYNGGTVELIAIDSDGQSSPDDRISVRDELPTLKLEMIERSSFVHAVYVHGQQIGVITEGALQSTKFVAPSNGSKFPAAFTMRIENKDGKVVLGGALVQLVSRLKYHNFAQGPKEGPRRFRLTLRAKENNFVASVETQFTVEGIDKPTELRLAHKTIIHRAPFFTVPSVLRQYIVHTYIPVGKDAVVFDEDTDRFSGGHLIATLVNAQKGDVLTLIPDSRMLYPVLHALDTQGQLSVGADGESIVFESRVIATVAAGGKLLLQRGGEWELEGQTSIHLEFAGDDGCSIAAVQALVRHVALLNVYPFNAKSYNTTPRNVQFSIQIMDSEQACQIVDEVQIKYAGHVAQLSERGCILDVRDGAPATRLGNFDISADRIMPITNFCGGFVLLTIADGFDSDLLSLKTDDADYKLVEESEKHVAKSPSKFFELPAIYSPQQQAAVTPRPPPPMKLESETSLKDRFRNAAKDFATARPPKQTTLASVVKEAVTLQRNRKFRVVFNGMRDPMARVTRIDHGAGVLIQIFPERERHPELTVLRKHIVALLRNLTYTSCAPSVCERTKVVRLLVADSAASTPSQVLLQISISDPPNKATPPSIRIQNNKIKYAQQPKRSVCVFPSAAVLSGDDSQTFAEGTLVVQCAADAVCEGDVIDVDIPRMLQISPPPPSPLPTTTTHEEDAAVGGDGSGGNNVSGVQIVSSQPASRKESFNAPQLQLCADGSRVIRIKQKANDELVEQTICHVRSNNNASSSTADGIMFEFNFPPPADGTATGIHKYSDVSQILQTIKFANFVANVVEKERLVTARFTFVDSDCTTPVEARARVYVKVSRPLAVLTHPIPIVGSSAASSFEEQFYRAVEFNEPPTLESTVGPSSTAQQQSSTRARPIWESIIVNSRHMARGGSCVVTLHAAPEQQLSSSDSIALDSSVVMERKHSISWGINDAELSLNLADCGAGGMTLLEKEVDAADATETDTTQQQQHRASTASLRQSVKSHWIVSPEGDVLAVDVVITPARISFSFVPGKTKMTKLQLQSILRAVKIAPSMSRAGRSKSFHGAPLKGLPRSRSPSTFRGDAKRPSAVRFDAESPQPPLVSSTPEATTTTAAQDGQQSLNNSGTNSADTAAAASGQRKRARCLAAVSITDGVVDCQLTTLCSW